MRGEHWSAFYAEKANFLEFAQNLPGGARSKNGWNLSKPIVCQISPILGIQLIYM